MGKQKNHLNERVRIYAIIWVLSYTGSLFVLKTQSVPKEAGMVVTFVTVLAFAVFLYKYYRSIFFMDEVEIKIQVEAVVIAFLLGLLLIMTLGLLDLTIVLDKKDWSFRFLIPCFIVFYFIGLFISNRKYSFENEKHN